MDPDNSGICSIYHQDFKDKEVQHCDVSAMEEKHAHHTEIKIEPAHCMQQEWPQSVTCIPGRGLYYNDFIYRIGERKSTVLGYAFISEGSPDLVFVTSCCVWNKRGTSWSASAIPSLMIRSCKSYSSTSRAKACKQHIFQCDLTCTIQCKGCVLNVLRS